MEIYLFLNSKFMVDFIGRENFIPGQVQEKSRSMTEFDIVMIGNFAKDELIVDGVEEIASGGGVYYGSVVAERTRNACRSGDAPAPG